VKFDDFHKAYLSPFLVCCKFGAILDFRMNKSCRKIV
jgi:hypothetical protein